MPDRRGRAAALPATLIPGDGIGPEITAAVIDGFWTRSARRSRGSASRRHGRPSRPAAIRCRRRSLDSIRRTKLALKGPLTTPVGGGFRSVNVRLREEFELYANVRPAHMVPGGRYEDIDIVLVRENLEGLYVGFEHYIPVGDDPHAVAISSGVNTRAGCPPHRPLRIRVCGAPRPQEGDESSIKPMC